MGHEGRNRAALRKERQERRILPRRQTGPRPELCRLPYAEMGKAGRQIGLGRRPAGNSLRQSFASGKAAQSLFPLGVRPKREVRSQAATSGGVWLAVYL